jgi:hypothetical protein
VQIAVGEGDTVRLIAGEPSVQVQVRQQPCDCLGSCQLSRSRCLCSSCMLFLR